MAKKGNTHGEGGVYPDSQRPGKFLVQIPDGHGKQIRRRAVDRKTAEALHKELLKSRADGLNISAAGKPLQWLVNEWKTKVLDVRQESKRPLSPYTVHDYKTTITRHLLPQWGMFHLEEFDVLLVLEIHTTLCREFSEAVAHRALTKLHMLLQTAEEWGFIRRNPVPIARRRIAPYVPPEKEALTPLETLQLLIAALGHRFENLYHVGLTLGLRPGELLGLQWNDIDWEKKTIEIRRQVQDINGECFIRNCTKYGEGKRELPLPPRLYARLRAMFDAGVKSIFLFPNDEYTNYTRPRSFRRHFAGGASIGRKGKDGKRASLKGMRDRAGLSSKITPHCFRHTVSTRLMELLTPNQVRDAIIGHGKDGVRELYGHAQMDVKRAALERLEEALYALDKDGILSVREQDARSINVN